MDYIKEKDEMGTFGVSKLCEWIFNNNTEEAQENYAHFVKPMILKMMMDSFHYICLMENTLQVENDQLSHITQTKPVMPIMCTFDKNCGYLCGFFTNRILNLVEDSDPNKGHRTEPNSYASNHWTVIDVQQKTKDNEKQMLIHHDHLKNMPYSAPPKLNNNNNNKRARYGGGSGKTRRRGDKIKSNGKITRRKPI